MLSENDLAFVLLADFAFATVIDPASMESLKGEADVAVAFVTKKMINHLVSSEGRKFILDSH